MKLYKFTPNSSKRKIVQNCHESVLGQRSNNLKSQSTCFLFWFQIVWKVLNVYHLLFLGWLFFCLSAVLGQCYCVLMKKKWYPHSHTHFVFVHIRHFYKKKKKMESSCLNKKEKILMFKVMLGFGAVISCVTWHENEWKKDLYFAVVNDLQCSGIWIYLKTGRISSGKGGMFEIHHLPYRFFLTNLQSICYIWCS